MGAFGLRGCGAEGLRSCGAAELWGYGAPELLRLRGRSRSEPYSPAKSGLRFSMKAVTPS